MCQNNHSIFLILASLAICNPASSADLIEEIRVSAHPLSETGIAQANSVLRGEALAEKIQGSLGETIAGEAGISSASFGAAVGRPVIHGLGGARVKTTQDRIDSLDVSVTSGDHAVTIEPFIANQINILKGASTLLYGSNAIGGVVDVETGRIPKTMPKQALGGRIEVRASDNAKAKVAAARLDGGFGKEYAWHLDATIRDADEYRIPGSAESSALSATNNAPIDQTKDLNLRLAGSQFENDGLAFGLSRIAEESQVGFSISILDAQYGLIGSLEEMPDEAASSAAGLIDMEQVRTDFEAQFENPFTGFESINFRFGINDYQHQEIEGSGELGTVFENDAWEGRIELNHDPIKGFQGTLGLQLNSRKFSAIGEEAFVPPVETQSAGLFWVGEKNFERFDLESGLRIENLEHRPTVSELATKDFSTFSSSLGIVVPFSNSLTVSGLLDYSSRAPSIEELYSNGAHLATQTFEVGDTTLKKETALAFSLTAAYEVQLVSVASTIYQMQFSDFIFQENSGTQQDDLPLFVYRQGDARFTGIDLKADFHMGEIASGDLDINLLFDVVRAELIEGANSNLPRIPARRLGLGVVWTNLNWLAKLNYQRVSAQQDVANFELATPSYNDFSIYLKRDLSWGDEDLSLFIHGRNLTDQDQRHHTSFIKELAPAPGRRFEVGVRFAF